MASKLSRKFKTPFKVPTCPDSKIYLTPNFSNKKVSIKGNILRSNSLIGNNKIDLNSSTNTKLDIHSNNTSFNEPKKSLSLTGLSTNFADFFEKNIQKDLIGSSTDITENCISPFVKSPQNREQIFEASVPVINEATEPKEICKKNKIDGISKEKNKTSKIKNTQLKKYNKEAIKKDISKAIKKNILKLTKANEKSEAENKTGHIIVENNSKLTHDIQKSQSSDIISQKSTSSQKKKFQLSQPPDGLSHREVLEWLQSKRNVGTWVRCDRPSCDKWRYLEDAKDPSEFPEEWFCSMNPDKNFASCSVPEQAPTPEEEKDLINSHYTAGSIVWAHVDGYPWWPAMVDDDPDTEQYYWLDEFSETDPTHYHVVFFDSENITRAWVTPKKLQPFKSNSKFSKRTRKADYTKRINTAIIQAEEAKQCSIYERLKKYSFLARWTGPIYAPKDKNVKEVKKTIKDKKEKKTNDKEDKKRITDKKEKKLTNDKKDKKLTNDKKEKKLTKDKDEKIPTNDKKNKKLTKEQLLIEIVQSGASLDEILSSFNSAQESNINKFEKKDRNKKSKPPVLTKIKNKKIIKKHFRRIILDSETSLESQNILTSNKTGQPSNSFSNMLETNCSTQFDENTHLNLSQDIFNSQESISSVNSNSIIFETNENQNMYSKNITNISSTIPFPPATNNIPVLDGNDVESEMNIDTNSLLNDMYSLPFDE